MVGKGELDISNGSGRTSKELVILLTTCEHIPKGSAVDFGQGFDAIQIGFEGVHTLVELAC